MSFIGLLESAHDVQRLRQIIHVFHDKGFGQFISQSRLNKFIPFKKRWQKKFEKFDKPMPVRVREAFEELGGVFVKFGQLLSLRPDLVPLKYIFEFEKLQDSVPEFSFEQAKEIVESELGKPMKKVFKEFSEKPVSAASFGQVHKAKLLNGKTVAVKVQRPGLKQIVERDISLLRKLVGVLQKHVKELQSVDLVEFVDEFERWTNEELDYQIEALHAIAFANTFKNSKDVYIPAVYRKFCTKKVLVMEFVSGIPINKIEKIKLAHVNHKEIMSKLLRAFVKQIFIDDIFHADPHPANILYIKKKKKIAFIDFGIIGRFDPQAKKATADMIKAVFTNNLDLLVSSLLSLGVLPSDFRKIDFRKDMRQLALEFQYAALEDIDLPKVIVDILSLIRKYRIKVPVDYILFSKTVITLDGLGLMYDPEFKLSSQVKPLIEKAMKKRLTAKKLLNSAGKTITDYNELIQILPVKINNALEKVLQGKLEIDIADTDIGSLAKEMEVSAGNLSVGIISAALVVTAALLIDIRTNFIYANFPWLSAALFVLVALLMVWLMERTVFKR